MGTSDNTHGNGALANGWTYLSFADGGGLLDGDLAQGMEDYVANHTPHTITTNTLEASAVGGDNRLGWNNFTSEIDKGRPVIFWVDTSGDGSGDHFVPVFGYDDTPGAYKYYAYTLWSVPNAGNSWYDFAQFSNSYSWGVGAMVAIQFLAGNGNEAFGPGGAGWAAGGDGWMSGGGPGSGVGSPEPETWALLILITAALVWARREQRHSTAAASRSDS